MLKLFRHNRETVLKYLMIFFLGIVSLGMVLTLTPLGGGDTTQMQANVLASLNGSQITTQELERLIDQQFRNSQFQNQPQLIAQIAGNLLDDLILQRALLAQAPKLGLEVSNPELAQAVRALPFLNVNGSFIGMDRYQDVIQQETGMTVPQFEAQLRASLLTQKIRDVVTDAVQVTPDEVHREYLRRNEKARIEYVVFDPSQYLKAVPVTAPALEAYFQSHADRYRLPEQRRVRYVLIDPDRVRAQVKITEADLRQYYFQHLQDYRLPDRVKVAHILFKTTGKTPPEIQRIKATAEDVLKQIRAGADFAALARKYSDDTTASNGGEVGWIVRGQTVKAFEDTAFALKPGEVSGLVTTEYGIHIIKCLAKQTAHLESFDEAKASIQAALEKQKLAEAQTALAAQLEDALKANPTQFETVAEKFGLKPQETPLFKYNQAVPDLGNNEGFENLAFQLRLNEVGPPLSLPKGVAIIQVAEIVPEHTPRLDEVRAQVEEDYRAEQSKVLAQEKAREFAARVKTADFRKVAAQMGLTVKESKDFTRSDDLGDMITGAEVSSAFTLPPGQTSGVIPAGPNQLVFRVLSRTPADESGFAAQQQQIADQLLDQKRNLAFEIYRQNLKRELLKSGALKLNRDAMNAFLAMYQRRS